MKGFYRIVLGICMVVSISITPLYAAQSGPRAYQNAPVGLQVAQFLYQNTEINDSVAVSPTIVLDTVVIVDSEVLRYYRYIDFFGSIALIGGYIPYANIDFEMPAASVNNKSKSGLADPGIAFGFNFYGAPALSLDEFKNWQQETILGASIVINPPLGSYDAADGEINLGGNRWVFKPEIAISHQFSDSKVFLESYLNAEFYSDNEEYLGGSIKTQSSKIGVDVHLVYAFMRGAYASLDYFNVQGGEVQVNNVVAAEKIDNTTFGTTLKVSFSPSTSVHLKYRDNTSALDDSTKETFQLKVQYLW